MQPRKSSRASVPFVDSAICLKNRWRPFIDATSITFEADVTRLFFSASSSLRNSTSIIEQHFKARFENFVLKILIEFYNLHRFAGALIEKEEKYRLNKCKKYNSTLPNFKMKEIGESVIHVSTKNICMYSD